MAAASRVHRKTYLPTYGMFDEQRYFARGRSIAAFDTKCGRVAILVCEDMLHPSAVTVAACDGATLIIAPSASPARGVTTEGEADVECAFVGELPAGDGALVRRVDRVLQPRRRRGRGVVLGRLGAGFAGRRTPLPRRPTTTTTSSAAS